MKKLMQLQVNFIKKKKETSKIEFFIMKPEAIGKNLCGKFHT